MRIIAGEFRSRRLLSPPEDWAVRPIPDRVKESLFSLLRGHCEGGVFFDGFAGTGSLGLEAISRGASRCVFVERDRRHADLLRANIKNLGADGRAEVFVGDALGPGAAARCPRPCTVVFLDPPYELVNEPVGWRRVRDQAARLIEHLTEDGFLIVRTPWPFLHEVIDDAASVAGPPRRAAVRRPEVEDAEEQPEAGRTTREPADLAIAGAVGPETHEYGSTAAHLYMRKK